MSTTKDLTEYYRRLAQNNQAGTDQYIDQQKSNAINLATNVLSQKYNNPQFNPYQNFYNYGANKQGYNANNDASLQAQYNKAVADYQAATDAQAMANAYGQQLQGSQDQASLLYQQGQKYAPSQLQAQGLGNTGLAETSQVGLMNTYANVLNQSRQQYGANMGELYGNLAAVNQQSNQALDEQLTGIYKNNLEQKQSSFRDSLEYVADVEELDDLFEANQEYLTEADVNKYQALRKELVQYEDQQKAEANITFAKKLSDDYGVLLDKNTKLPTETYDMDTIKNGKFGQKGDGQTEYLQRISALMEAGKFKNGDTFNLNIGGGKRIHPQTYVYYDGKLYKTDKKHADVHYGWDRIKKLYNNTFNS